MMNCKRWLIAFFLITAPLLTLAKVSVDDFIVNPLPSGDLRFVELTNFVLDGDRAQFQIRLLCDEAFVVKSMYTTVRDETEPVDFRFSRAVLLNDVFDGAVAPPTSWRVAHEDLEIEIGDNSGGVELLSNMDIPALGVGDNGSFDIIGSRNPNTRASTMSIGAVVKTNNIAANECRIVVVDF